MESTSSSKAMGGSIGAALRQREEDRDEHERQELYDRKVRPFLDGVRDLLEAARPMPGRVAALKRKHGAWFEEHLAELGAPLPETESRRLRDLHREARGYALSTVDLFNTKGPALEAVIAKLDNWTPEDTGDYVVQSHIPDYRSKLDQIRNPEAHVEEARRKLEELLPQIAEACSTEPLRLGIAAGRGAMATVPDRATHAIRSVNAFGERA
jgi:hypothetical protein